LPKPKILFLDIETFPNIGFTWGKWQQNVIRFTQESCIATYAAKWLDGPVFAKGLPSYRGYKPKSYDDAALVKDIWKLLDEADIAVAHNGDNFDFRVCKARFIYHNMMPPAPFKTVDTKKVAKKVARFNSNKLDDLGQLFGIGQKIKTDFDLWQGCIDGDLTAWAQMVKYNKEDVVLLEKLYKRLLPWTANHPNYAVLDSEAICAKCGSRQVQFRGYAITQSRQYRRFQCKECGGWGREVRSEKGTGVKTTHVAD
jgi:DNA polymerase elongation subunit (family B)